MAHMQACTYAISNQRKHACNYAIKQGKTKARMQKSYHRLCIMYTHALNNRFYLRTWRHNIHAKKQRKNRIKDKGVDWTSWGLYEHGAV